MWEAVGLGSSVLRLRACERGPHLGLYLSTVIAEISKMKTDLGITPVFTHSYRRRKRSTWSGRDISLSNLSVTQILLICSTR
jgi:hypothetical protein